MKLLSGEEWIYAYVVALTGHHAEDIVRAIRKTP
jgi:hypothetical protein